MNIIRSRVPASPSHRVLAARYELQLISSCGWLRVAANSILRLSQDPPAGFNLRLTYTLIYPINLRIYSAKYIIFIVFFLPADLKKSEESWRNFKTLALTDSSCSGWFKLWRLIRDLCRLVWDLWLNRPPPEFWSQCPLIIIPSSGVHKCSACPKLNIAICKQLLVT